MLRRQFLSAALAAPAAVAGSARAATSQIAKCDSPAAEGRRPRFALCLLNVDRPDLAPDSLIDILEHDGSDVTWDSSEGLVGSSEEAFGRCAEMNADELLGDAEDKFGWWVVVEFLREPETTLVVTLESDGKGDVDISETWRCRLVRPTEGERARYPVPSGLREAIA